MLCIYVSIPLSIYICLYFHSSLRFNIVLLYRKCRDLVTYRLLKNFLFILTLCYGCHAYLHTLETLPQSIMIFLFQQSCSFKCILTLYPATLLNSCISPTSFFLDFFGFFTGLTKKQEAPFSLYTTSLFLFYKIIFWRT